MTGWDCKERGHITPPGEDACRVCGEADEWKCGVCHTHPAKGVCSSGLGPISLAYCAECLKQWTEAEWLVEFTLGECGSWENVREDIKELLHVWRPDGEGGGSYVLATEVYSDEDVARLLEESKARDREIDANMQAADALLDTDTTKGD